MSRCFVSRCFVSHCSVSRRFVTRRFVTRRFVSRRFVSRRCVSLLFVGKHVMKRYKINCVPVGRNFSQSQHGCLRPRESFDL